MNRQNIEKRFESGERLSILLSLDGGGIRGLVLIRVRLLKTCQITKIFFNF